MKPLDTFELAVALSEINNKDAAERDRICTQAVDALTWLQQPATSSDLAKQLLDLAKKAEADRKATESPYQERIYLGARDAFEIAAHMANKAAVDQAAKHAREKDKLQRQVQFGAQLYRKLTTARLVTHADGGQYIHLGTAHGAGMSRGKPPVEIYRSIEDGRLWFRDPADFAERMKP